MIRKCKFKKSRHVIFSKRNYLSSAILLRQKVLRIL